MLWILGFVCQGKVLGGPLGLVPVPVGPKTRFAQGVPLVPMAGGEIKGPTPRFFKPTLRPRVILERTWSHGGKTPPKGGASGWSYQGVFDPNFPWMDDGDNLWMDATGDGVGGFWASYVGTDANHNYDTVWVLLSTNGGSSWQCTFKIYSTTPGYHPYVAKMSTDRNGWVYLAVLVAQEADVGTHYPGTLWLARWHHAGDGEVDLYSLVQVDPEGWGEIYATCAVAPDGLDSKVYVLGIDWSNGYLDCYESQDRGESWSYKCSLDMGSFYTAYLWATPKYGSSGVMVAWCDGDDEDRNGNGSTEDYVVGMGTLDDDGIGCYVFTTSWPLAADPPSPAWWGDKALIAAECPCSDYDFNIYYYWTTDGGATWGLSALNNSTDDTRSPYVAAVGDGSFAVAFWLDEDGDHLGRPVLLATSDMLTWGPWYEEASQDVTSDEPTQLGAGDRLKVVAVAPEFFGEQWFPSVLWWDNTQKGSGVVWEAYLTDFVAYRVSETGGDASLAYTKGKLAWRGRGLLEVYDAAGRRVMRRKVSGEGETNIELPKGVYVASLGGHILRFLVP